MRISLAGGSRIVVFAFKLAFKIPYLRNFKHCRRCNLLEVSRWKEFGSKEFNGVSLCPVRFYLPFGILLVMPEAEHFSPEEWSKITEYEKNIRFYGPAQSLGVMEDYGCRTSYGKLNGKIVVIDYGFYISPEQQKQIEHWVQEL